MTNEEQEKPKEQEQPAETVTKLETDAKANAQLMVDNANAAAARLEKANTEMRQMLEAQAAAKSEQILGGQSEAGIEPATKTESQKEHDAARKLLAGTGFDDQFFPIPPKDNST